MLRNVLSRCRSSRFLSLVCVASLCTNVFFLVTSRNMQKVVYRRQDLVNFRVEDSGSWTTQLLSSNNASKYQNAATGHAATDIEAQQSTPGTTIARPPHEINDTLCPLCPFDPPGLLGPLADMHQDMTPEKLIEYFPEVRKGRIRPKDCVAREKTAIIIPYRNRYPHLHILLHNLIPFLTRQQVDATVFVIEQAPPEIFNRGALLNVGFLESEKTASFDCFIFHDVDLIPLDDRHLYRCGDNPKHFAVAMNKYHFRLPYPGYFGGAVGFTKRQYLDINGCSNVYFGWGGEDDEMKDRSLNKGYIISRAPVSIARYDMIRHTRDKGNEPNPIRKKILATAKQRQDIEGLNTIKYTVNSVKVESLYTWINVSFNQTEILQSAPSYIIEAMLQAQREAEIEKQKAEIRKQKEEAKRIKAAKIQQQSQVPVDYFTPNENITQQNVDVRQFITKS